MKKLLLLLAIPMVLACEKLDINQNNLIGKWAEEYSGYPYFVSEGYINYDFKSDGTVSIHLYDVFAGDSDVQNAYQISENGVITLIPEKSDLPGEQYTIVKLTKKEMEWQRVGTTFQKGSVGSDFRHFLRK
jgi:hypothetical protein